jgi:SAM-dependent methyltransferase
MGVERTMRAQGFHHTPHEEDVAGFLNRRRVVQAYSVTQDVHQEVASRFAAERLGRILDLGCGEGVLGRLLAGSAVRWTGLDRSTGLLERAPAPKVRGDAVALPLVDGTFDGVAALYMLYRLDEPRLAIAEAHRVLRPGGIFAAATPSRFDAPELADLLPQERSTFDAELAPELIGEVFEQVEVQAWDGPYVHLPDVQALGRYLAAYGVPPERAGLVAETHRDRVPLALTKRGALVYARKSGR